MLTPWFEENYNQAREISINEAMVPFKGRSSMKQYLPMNPVKRDFKVCMLADGNTRYIYIQAECVYWGNWREK